MSTNCSNIRSQFPLGGLHKSSPAAQFTPDGAHDRASELSNVEWLTKLSGQQGDEAQQIAHQAVSSYLYAVAINVLWLRKSSVSQLSQYGISEIEALAEDFVQSFCYKLVENNYALLDKYSGRGRFLAWAAQVLRNMISSEFRKRQWKETERLAVLEGKSGMMRVRCSAKYQKLGCPDLIFHHNQLADLVESVLTKLSSNHQVIFLRYVLEGERAYLVAEDLGMTDNGVYTAARRIREVIGKALVEAGYR